MDATILGAISGANPSGENLRYELIYGEICKRIRRAQGEVFSHPGDLDYCSTDEDWRFVARTCRDLLMRRSKDLMLAAWLTQAQFAIDGFAGLRDGLDILRELMETFWETLYPEIEDGDVEARVRILEWLDKQLAAGVNALFAGDQRIDDPDGRRRRDRELELCIRAQKGLADACWERLGGESSGFEELSGALMGHLSADDHLAALLMDAQDLPETAPELPPMQRERQKQIEEVIRRAKQLKDSGNFDQAVSRLAEANLPDSQELRELLDTLRQQLEAAKRLDAAALPPPGAHEPAPRVRDLHVGQGRRRLPTLSESVPAPAIPPPMSIGCEPQKVEFTLTAPEAVKTGTPFELFVWAHESQERSKVLVRAREELSVRDLLVRSKGPFKVASGTVLNVRLAIPGAVIDDAEDTMVWDGESTCVSFVVMLPQESQETKWAGSALIYANGVKVARISFVLSAVGVAEISNVRYKKAFASYASPDRDAVLGRIQGIHKIAPELDVFLDVLSLRSGQNWEQELWRVIPASDIFYLFWSTHARESEWVEKEWRCALRERGIEFIDPIPLESPQGLPPPQELSSLHFNDWELAFRRGKLLP